MGAPEAIPGSPRIAPAASLPHARRCWESLPSRCPAGGACSEWTSSPWNRCEREKLRRSLPYRRESADRPHRPSCLAYSSRAAQPGIFQRLVSRLLPFPLAAGCTRDPQAAPVSAAIGASISWFPYYLRILDKLSFMLDLAFLRNNLEAVEARLSRRGGSAGLERFRELDRERRAAITQVERLKALRNAGSEEVARARREGRDTTEQQARLRELGEQIRLLE